MDTSTAINIYFDPLLPHSWLAFIAVIGGVLLILSAWQKRSFPLFRTLCVGIFILALMHPSILEEERQGADDVAVIVYDQSASQNFGQRKHRADQALEYVQEELSSASALDLRVLQAPLEGSVANDTRLFSALDQAFSDVPLSRRAGVIFLSDGQIHDIPDNPEFFKQYGPVHVLLTGEKDEKDRQLFIAKAPAYGIVGQSVTLEYKIEDSNNIKEEFANVTISSNAQETESFSVEIGKTLKLDLPIEHAGQNVFEIHVEDVNGEITTVNNHAALIVNGVRDRLRVLLVSGKPHAGGRTWRDLLTSDPGVDLIHFTILREPSKLDSTPQNELSLIAFPFRELFEIKLYEFDLIIFDRYRLNHILPNHYFENITKYVREGGALLVSSGPAFAGEDSIYNTALKDILPGTPNGQVIKKPFRPTVTENGHRHPVTRSLVWNTNAKGEQVWGDWLRQVVLNTGQGDILMSGADEQPLLILNRVEQGRVAQIASDHIWLWSRGYEQGGPHREFLRRVVHWLMKEPELDERALDVQVNGQQITVRSQSYNRDKQTITMTKPGGDTGTIELTESKDGFLEHTFRAETLGIYSFEDQDGQKRFAVIGETNPPEYRAVRTTDAPLSTIIKASGGGAIWLNETPKPDIGLYAKNSRFAGRDWIGLQRNNDFVVTGVREQPILPSWLSMLLLLGLVTLTWWLEGQRS